MPTFDLYLPPRSHSAWRPTRASARPATVGEASVHPIVAARRLFASWIERIRQRRALAALDDGMLRDIGITRLEAARECEKPFWR